MSFISNHTDSQLCVDSIDLLLLFLYMKIMHAVCSYLIFNSEIKMKNQTSGTHHSGSMAVLKISIFGILHRYKINTMEYTAPILVHKI